MRPTLPISPQFLQSVLDSLPAPIAILDQTGLIVAVNAAWRRFADDNGLKWPDYGLGRNYLTVLESACGNSAEEAWNAARALQELIGGQRDHFWFEYPYHTPRQKSWFVIRATRFEGGDGPYVAIAHEDITEHKWARELLQQQTRELAERTKELDCLYGFSGLVDKAATSLPEILEGTLNLIMSAWQWPEITCVRISLDGEEYQSENLRETTWRLARDIVVWGEPAGKVEVFYLEERPEQGEGPFLQEERNLLNSIAGRLGRTAERIRAQAALHESRALYRDLYENAPYAYFTVGVDGRIRRCNQHAVEILGYTLPELIGRPVLGIYADTPDGKKKAAQVLRRFKAGESVTDEELEMQKADGSSVWVSLTVNAIRDAQGHIVESRSVAVDVTARRRTEEALRQAKEAAEAARREEQERRQEAERRRRIAECLREVLGALNSNWPLDKVLDYIAERAGELLGTRAAGIYSLEADLGIWVVRATHGLLVTYVAGLDIPLGQPALQQSLVSRRPVAVTDMRIDLLGAGIPRANDRQLAAALSWARVYRALLAVPIVVHGEIYGGMLLYYGEPRAFSDEEIELAILFGEQVALAIANAQLREQVQQAAAGAERERLARELHDAVTQTLFSASLIAEAVPQIWDANPEEGRRGLEELRQLTRGALAEMRTMLLGLRPAALTEKPMGELLRHLAEAVTSRTRMPVALRVEGDSALPPDVQVALYRIAQEALNNVAKHAEASHVSVDLHSHSGWVSLEVSDDGCGFDEADILPDRMGLSIMRERAERIGAALEIQTQPGQGTQVVVNWSATDGEAAYD